jgi:Fis family transcriptional regulator
MSHSAIHQAVQHTLHQYFSALQGETPHQLHQIITQEVEYALLDFVMTRTGHNQSMAAKWLGINRNTLRNKLAQYHLLQAPLSHPTGDLKK